MSFYSGKKVLITGGSSGIGLSAALQLAREGAHVGLVARRQAVLDEAIAQVRAAGGAAQRFATFSVDVTDRDAVRQLAVDAVEQLGGLDILINNSGFAYPVPMLELTDDQIDRMTAVNYLGHVNVTRALLPHFVAQRSGHICNVTSMLGFMGIYGYSAYCGSKYAIVGMSECLRQEMLPHNVQVSVFYPPTTDTPGLAEENTVKPPETWAIEGKSQAFHPDQVAGSLLAGIRKGRFTNMIGAGNWAIFYAQRFAPWLVRAVTDAELRKHMKKRLAGS